MDFMQSCHLFLSLTLHIKAKQEQIHVTVDRKSCVYKTGGLNSGECGTRERI